MRIHLDDLIACGGNGRVYRAHTTSDEKPRIFAVKKLHTNKQIQRPMLRHEACAMVQLRGHPSIPTVYALGRSQYAEYLALELLGPDIYTGTLDTPSGLTMRNLAALACQMIDALQHVHALGLAHCDVKPCNFLFDHNHAGRIKLIDFGMAQLFRDPKTLEHRPEGRIPYFVGTRTYASLNVHYHITPTRRDDLESLALTILTLLCGRLPWQNLYGAEILPEKAKWSGAAIGACHPPIFGAFLDDARAMAFDAEPQYAVWKQRFRDLVPGIPDSPLYDREDCERPVGVSHWQFESPSVDILTPPQSVHEMLADSDDDWVPTSDWPEPMNVLREDLLGDERETVERMLERIDKVPTMDEIWTNPNFCGPEYMVDY
ncbi:kinase-like domain-containing protein [Schizophyllum commune]